MRSITILMWLLPMLFTPSGLLGGLLNCDMERADTTAVVTAEKRIESVDKFEALLEAQVKIIRENKRFDNFILFVHGRGQHPCHAFDKSLIADLEVDYSAKVIMFHWPSWNGPMAYPESNARKAARDLRNIIGKLAEYRSENTETMKGIKFTLLTHSMGSIVLEEVMLNEGGEAITGAFDTLVINASASWGGSHAQWVEKIRMSEHIYITVNQHDPTLGKAELYEEWRYRDQDLSLLGKALESKNGDNYTLAENATYVDLTQSPLRHVYYIHRYLQDSSAAKYFFDMALNGLPVNLKKGRGVVKVNRGRIYTLARDLGDP